jgi:cysteine-rich repeat protein
MRLSRTLVHRAITVMRRSNRTVARLNCRLGLAQRTPYRVVGHAALMIMLWGCGAKTSEPDVDGQSHWWKSCALDADCSDGFECACGACTRGCESVETCGKFEGARCSSRANVCSDDPGMAAARVCQVACSESADCPGALRCEAGACVGVSGSAQVTSAESSSGTSDGLTGALCGDSSTQCPPPPPDWCGSEEDAPVPQDLAEYWSSFCDAGSDSSVVNAAVCGDGILHVDEVCDDGNTTSGDGCSSTCDAVELNWDCTGSGAPCTSQ